MTTTRRMHASIAGSAVTATSAQDAAQQAGLDWHVSLADLEALAVNDEGVSRIKVPDRFATIRTDKDGGQTALGTVGTRYKVFQNGEMFPFLCQTDFKFGKGRNITICPTKTFKIVT